MATGVRSVALLRWTIGMSVLVAVYQATAFSQGYQPSQEFQRIWGYVFVLLLAFWVDEDSRGRPEIDRPSFDVALFVYLIWVLYLPYYLLQTRGSKGWIWIVGLIALASLGTILQWIVYAAM
jgi:hypothetical protein